MEAYVGANICAGLYGLFTLVPELFGHNTIRYTSSNYNPLVPSE